MIITYPKAQRVQYLRSNTFMQVKHSKSHLSVIDDPKHVEGN